MRVVNELGTVNGKPAKFAVIVSSSTSIAIGLVFLVLILVFCQEFSLAFISSAIIKEAVSKLVFLLAFTILVLLNPSACVLPMRTKSLKP